MKDEELIQCVQKYRYLYDKSDPLHKSKKNTQEGWAEIAAVFQVKVQVVRKRWAYLRDYFQRQHKYYDSLKSEEWFAKKKKWALYDSLTFLLPSMEHGDTTISDGVSETHQYPDLSDDTSEESISVTADSHLVETVKSQQNMSLCQQPKRKRTKKDLDNQFSSAPGGQHEDDDHELFLKSLLPTMRKLNPPAAMEYRQEIQVQVVRKRWAYLRDYFRKQKQSYDSIKSEEWFAKKKKWALYDSLTFLLPSMEYHNTTISDGVSETHQYPDLSDDTSKESISLPFDSHFMETVISQENMPICQQPERKRTKKDLDNQFFSGLRGQHEDDDHEHFFKSLLPGMRTLNPLAAMEYRQEVQGLLIEYIKKDECTGFAEAESS